MNDEINFNRTRGVAGPGNPPFAALSVGSGRTRVELELHVQGLDWLLVVTGGKAHVGAVAVWSGPARESKAVVTELPGHREGPLAGECAEILGRASGRTVAVVAGIHQDEATREEIDAIVAHVRRGAGELARAVERARGTERPAGRNPGFRS